jgi:uncharacterized membrane protein YccF (DUF307 family)
MGRTWRNEVIKTAVQKLLAIMLFMLAGGAWMALAWIHAEHGNVDMVIIMTVLGLACWLLAWMVMGE